jgi:hypothetical protein
MPGSANCARCGAILSLANVAIDVHPPRATSLGKSLAGLWRVRWVGIRFWEQIWSRVPRWAEGTRFPELELGLVLRGIVPGWINLHLGRNAFGWGVIIAYTIFMVSGLMMLVTQFGAMLVGIAFAVHLNSVVVALMPRFETFGDRLRFTGISALALALLVFVPAGALLSRIATPVSINRSLPPLLEGDVVWYHRTSTVKAGQLILYDDPGSRLWYTAGYHGAFAFAAGMRISRVVATEGQRLSWDSQILQLDGQPAPESLRGLGEEYKAIWNNSTIPPASILIDPLNLALPAMGLNNAQIQQALIIPVDRVTGVVVFRTWPLDRAGFFH